LNKLKFIYLGSLFFWLFLICVICVAGNATKKQIDFYPYYANKVIINDKLINKFEYKSVSDLLYVFSNLEKCKTKDGHFLNTFEWCCDFIRFIGTNLEYDYQIMNLIIFIVCLPLFIFNILVILIAQHLVIKKLSI